MNIPSPLQSRLQSEKKIWFSWWQTQTWIEKALPLLIAIAYLFFLQAFHVLRSDHYQMSFAGLLLWYLGPRLRPFFKFILPLLLVGIIYDSQRI